MSSFAQFWINTFSQQSWNLSKIWSVLGMCLMGEIKRVWSRIINITISIEFFIQGWTCSLPQLLGKCVCAPVAEVRVEPLNHFVTRAHSLFFNRPQEVTCRRSCVSAGRPRLLFTLLLTHQLRVDHCTNEVAGVGQRKVTWHSSARNSCAQKWILSTTSTQSRLKQ